MKLCRALCGSFATTPHRNAIYRLPALFESGACVYWCMCVLRINCYSRRDLRTRTHFLAYACAQCTIKYTCKPRLDEHRPFSTMPSYSTLSFAYAIAVHSLGFSSEYWHVVCVVCKTGVCPYQTRNALQTHTLLNYLPSVSYYVVRTLSLSLSRSLSLPLCLSMALLMYYGNGYV